MSFSEEMIEKVWKKGTIVPNYNSSKWRKDKCGAWMNREQYGNVKSIYGWEIDHIKPTSDGGRDELSNLQPLQWANNREKADGALMCAVVSDGKKNKTQNPPKKPQ